MGRKGRMTTTEQINKMDGKGIQEKMQKEIKTQKALRNGRSRMVQDEERERNIFYVHVTVHC
jgi:hypothetical protein